MKNLKNFSKKSNVKVLNTKQTTKVSGGDCNPVVTWVKPEPINPWVL